jgi:cytoskeletal protein RodZ
MKRCPQCEFIYLDTDEVCDLDGAKLLQVADSELSLNDTAKGKSKPARSKLSPILVAAIGGVLLGALVFISYLVFVRARQQTQAQTTVQQVPRTLPSPVTVAVAPTPEPSPSPEASPVASPKQTQGEQTKRVAMSKDPVSTSTNEKTSGPIWIRLSNGARIEADEVWRTKEGVWYRRNGVVTLIKSNRVKAIEKAK